MAQHAIRAVTMRDGHGPGGPTDSPPIVTQQSTPPAPGLEPARKRSVLVRWARLCVYGAFGLLIASELLGDVWPFVLITPALPKLGIVAIIGVLLSLISTTRGVESARRARIRFVLGGATTLYCFVVAWGWVPWRTLPHAARWTGPTGEHATVTVLSANVHTGNHEYARLIQLIEREDPDVVLLMELDSGWLRALEGLRERYLVSRVVPDDEGNFGIGFWTRLEVADAELVLLKPEEPDTLNDVPQVRATLRARDASGSMRDFRIYGLHPLPPIRPGWHAARDLVLATAAREIRDGTMPAMVVGDLNATRYCRVVQRTAREAQLGDATADLGASWPNTWSRFATGIRLDHLLLTQEWHVESIRSSDDIGSDHSPLVARLVLAR